MPARARIPSVLAAIALALIAALPGCGGDDDDDGGTPTCGPCGPGMECGADGLCTCIPNASKWCDGHGTIRWKDGCGNLGPVFAACASGKCYGSECVDCTPSCGERVCGGDGCGGSCGECPEGSTCNKAGTICEPSPCPDGQECGKDSCGNVCGTCPEGEICALGQCRCADEDGRFCLDGQVNLCDPDAPECPDEATWVGTGGFPYPYPCPNENPCECGRCTGAKACHYENPKADVQQVYFCSTDAECCAGAYGGTCCSTQQTCEGYYHSTPNYPDTTFCLDPGEFTCPASNYAICSPGGSCCYADPSSSEWTGWAGNTVSWCCPEGTSCCGSGTLYDPTPLCCGADEFCVNAFLGPVCCKKDTQFVCDESGIDPMGDLCCDVGQECVDDTCVDI